ncbi:22 kDa translocon at the inner membrane of chloroplasts [Haematococcus lacustris]
MADPPNALVGVGQPFEVLRRGVEDTARVLQQASSQGISHLTKHISQQPARLLSDATTALSSFWPLVTQQCRETWSSGSQGPGVPLFASVGMSMRQPTASQQLTCQTLNIRTSAANPLGDLAMAKDEVKARLAPIPVFTVANPKNEFVLVAGENNTQLGFFFFKRSDAEAIVEKIKEENPRLARDSRILRVTMDNVFEVFTTPREQTGLQGIHFRFMPDMRQVGHAMALYQSAGLPTRSFTGVPVFQAEGLTVTTQEVSYVPLFLAKEDLDIAVQGAYKLRNAPQIKLLKDKASKLEEDYNQVAVQAGSATGREKGHLEHRAAKLKSKLDVAREKAEAIEQAPMPKIEVGSFEEVMQRMTASSGSELTAWSQVMFVAPGLLHQTLQKDEAVAVRK